MTKNASKPASKVSAELKVKAKAKIAAPAGPQIIKLNSKSYELISNAMMAAQSARDEMNRVLSYAIVHSGIETGESQNVGFSLDEKTKSLIITL